MSEAIINATKILSNSELLYSEETLLQRIHEMSIDISASITDDIPIFFNVMNGSIFFFTELLKHIKKPLLIDYLQATRYNNTTTGAKEIAWLHKPNIDNIINRNIYVIDDVLDEGYTLDATKNFFLANGAKSCKIVVLVDKMLGREKPISADWVGFTAPNKYLFGFGMDVFGLYRQLPYLLTYNNQV